MSAKLDLVVDAGLPTTDDSKASEILSGCIAELEARRRAQVEADIRPKDNIPLQNKIVKLVGSKPLFACQVDKVETQVLLDSGSQISSLGSEWVRDNCPEAEIHPVSDFLEEGEEVRFSAVNDTEVPMLGCVVLNFSIGKYSFPVPFLVTESKLPRPLIGYSVSKPTSRGLLRRGSLVY